MATGQLVPHVLPSGQTVMIPDYLAPKQGAGALALPIVPKPSVPDTRVAGPGGGAFERPSPAQFGLGWTGAGPSLGAKPKPPPKPDTPSDADPGELEQVKAPDPRAPSGSTQDTAMALFGPRRPGGGKAKPPDPNNMNLVAAEVKQERQPGKRLLPEQEWRLGISERPDELYEPDPEVEKIWPKSTWGDEEDVPTPLREKLTPLERGANLAGQSAKREFSRQVQLEQEMGVARRAQLAEESALIDQNLQTIAERRKRIAELQDIADRRMQEAETTEPRTKSEIWESKGGAANVLALLAIAIGGFAQGLGRNGGKNPGWDMINGALDDEVEAERDRAERRYKVGMNAKNDVERAMATYGDLDAAMLESKSRKLANVMAMTQEQLADRSLDAMSKERAAQVYEAAKEAYFANKQQLFDSITGKVVKEEATLKPYGQVLQMATPKPTGGGGGGAGGAAGKGAGAPYGISPEEYRKFTKEERAMAVKLPAGITMPGGRADGVAFVRDPSARQETQQRLGSLNRMRSNLLQIQKWRADKGKTLPLSEARGKIQALAGDFTLGVKSGEQLGALDKGSVEFMGNLIGNPEQFTVLDDTTEGKIKQQLKIIDSKIRSIMDNELDNSSLEITSGGQSVDGLEK